MKITHPFKKEPQLDISLDQTDQLLQKNNESKADQNTPPSDVEELLSRLGGFGRFQYLLVISFAVLATPEMVQAFNMYYVGDAPNWRFVDVNTTSPSSDTTSPSSEIFPSSNKSRCDYPRSLWKYDAPKDYSVVTEYNIDCGKEWQIQLASSAFFMGIAFGAVILGWFSDNFGRRKVLVPTYFVLQIWAVASCFSPNMWFLTTTRFLMGFCMPALGANLSTMLSELVLPKYRAKSVMGLYTLVPVGNSLLSVFAYFIPHWRYMIAAVILPNILVSSLLLFTPESLHWLLLHDRSDEIHKLCDRIAFWNRCPKIEREHLIVISNGYAHEKRKSSPRELFIGCHMVTITLVQGFTWLICSVVYYSLVFASNSISTGSKYVNFSVICFAELPGLLVACFVLDRFGRKMTIMVSLIFAAVCCTTLAAAPNVTGWSEARLCIGFLGRLFTTMNYVSLFVWTNEVFPTHLRAQGMGFCSVMSRIGGISAPWLTQSLVKTHVALPFSLMAGLSFLNAALITLMPETKNRRLEDANK